MAERITIGSLLREEIQPAPDLSQPQPVPFEPAPALSVPAVVAFEPAPDLSSPRDIPFEQAPALSSPGTVPFEEAPDLSAPAGVDFEPAPALSSPGEIAFEPAPPLRVPVPPPREFAPKHTLPAEIPFEPPPPLYPPRDAPPEIAPPLSSPGTIPFEPAPALSSPGKLPDPPGFSPAPNATLPSGPAFSPDPNAVIPFEDSHVSGKEYAPNGVIEPAADVLGSGELKDERTKTFLKRLDADPFSNPLNGPYSALGGGPPGEQGLNPQLAARHAAALVTQVGPVQVAKFAAEQASLFSLNREGKVWNALAADPPPGVGGIMPAAVDAGAGGTHEERVRAGADRLAQLAAGSYTDFQATASPPFVSVAIEAVRVGPSNAANSMPPRPVGAASQDSAQVDDPLGTSDPSLIGRPLVEAARLSRNLYTDEEPYGVDTAGSYFTLGGLVSSFTDEPGSSAADEELVVSDPATGGKRVDIRQLYQPVLRNLRDTSTPLEYRPLKGAPGGSVRTPLPAGERKLARAYYSSGIIPAKIPGDGDFGFIRTTIRREDPSQFIDDDDAYVPLSFMDLRPLAGSNSVRTVYLRPFITNLSEEISPEWNKQSFFARVDPVATYVSTGRVINLGFFVHAFSPEDLKVIYQKKGWITSMCYPTYDRDLLMKSGPVIRLRVGDLLKTRGGFGLPGFIENINFEYTDLPWELTRGSKVPQGFKVSLSFAVLHEKPIGLGVDGQFGGIGRIDQDTGRWSPLDQTNRSQSQDAPEMSSDAASDFGGGPGSDMNRYSDG